MNEPESLDPTTHKQATLLPWYLADTLDREEKREVEAHLNSCETCQMELDEMKHTRAAVRAAVSEREGPSPAVLTQVMARIREEKSSTQPSAAPVSDESPGIWSQVEAWLQSLFAVPWVPVLATILIVGQSALLLTDLDGKPGSSQPGLGTSPIIERGLPTAPTPSTSSQFHVVFVETASQGEIQSLLQQVHAQIISGPSSNGLYVIEIPTIEPTEIQSNLQTLRNQPAIIRSAKSAIP